MALLRKEDLVRDSSVLPQTTNSEIGMGALLGKGSRFEGKLTFEGTVQIDGEFVGEITSMGSLILGENAQVDGKISIGSAVLSGSFRGTLQTQGTLELKSSARVTGDLIVANLIVEKGAFFEGTVRMTGGEQLQ